MPSGQTSTSSGRTPSTISPSAVPGRESVSRSSEKGPSDRAITVGGDDAALEEVHRAGADKRRHVRVDRPVVHVIGGTDLLYDTIPHDDEPVGHGHGLDLVVGHVDRCPADPAVKPEQLRPHLHPQQSVEVGQGLVHEKRHPFPHDGATQGDALSLPARELVWIAVQLGLQMQQGREVNPIYHEAL